MEFLEKIFKIVIKALDEPKLFNLFLVLCGWLARLLTCVILLLFDSNRLDVLLRPIYAGHSILVFHQIRVLHHRGFPIALILCDGVRLY